MADVFEKGRGFGFQRALDSHLDIVLIDPKDLVKQWFDPDDIVSRSLCAFVR
jgi:hypothetical protein